MSARFIAQRTLTGEFLDWDLPLSEDRYIRELSGPGTIEGTLEPELLQTVAADGLPVLLEWDTTLHVEVDDQIRKSALITSLDYEGEKLTVTAGGYSTYPVGIPYMKNYLPSDFPDPAKVIHDIWAYVQSFPDGDLGVRVVNSNTWLRVGNGDGGPYRIYWYEIRDCGDEINTLLSTGPMDFIEDSYWTDSTRSAVQLDLRVGFPRVGRRRHDLRFVEGENITAVVPFVAEGLEYAQDVYGFGQGEGDSMIRSRIAVPNGRVRRCATYFDKTATKQRLQSTLRREFERHSNTRDIKEISIIDHPNARIGEIDPGDDILVQTDVPWLGPQAVWSRVLTIEESTAQTDRAILTLQRADTFNYAPGKSPTGNPVTVDAGSTAAGSATAG